MPYKFSSKFSHIQSVIKQSAKEFYQLSLLYQETFTIYRTNASKFLVLALTVAEKKLCFLNQKISSQFLQFLLIVQQKAWNWLFSNFLISAFKKSIEKYCVPVYCYATRSLRRKAERNETLLQLGNMLKCYLANLLAFSSLLQALLHDNYLDSAIIHTLKKYSKHESAISTQLMMQCGVKSVEEISSVIFQKEHVKAAYYPDMFKQSPHLSSFKMKSPTTLNPPVHMTINAPAQGSSPLLSPVLSDVGGARVEEEDEARRKRYPADKAYFIAKEILATERTYLKDLEVLTVWFRSAVIKENAMPEVLMTLFFSNIDPIYEFHRGFLKELEQRLALWEGRSNASVKGDYQRIGDVMLRNMHTLKEFTSYLQKHDEVLTELEKATKRIKKLEMVYKEFELQKVCYLPLNTFLLKPIQRLMHYKLILGRLCKHYVADHRDYADCRNALKEITEMTSQLQNSLIRLENFQKLTELQHDLLGIDNLVAAGREFIREGCLYKLTKKGLQQRMFFLVS
ncbi:FERM, ARHGEF and pleckstrin domain-containing protein 2 [Varanus komodoensis]|nr:FERM, ARHGEF and pleckstrin domain-containing protein 2 [Varanus komodoensis]